MTPILQGLVASNSVRVRTGDPNMASIERTAYPRFRRLVTAREMASLTPGLDELAWIRERTRSNSHMLALAVSLKCFQRLGYFPNMMDVPQAVTDHIRRCPPCQAEARHRALIVY